MMADTEQKKQEVYFVWAKTERAGDIVTPAEIQDDAGWLLFTDGTRINPSLVNECLLQTRSLREAETMSNDLGFKTNNTTSNMPGHRNPPSPPKVESVVPVEPVQPKGEFNVMIAMLEKMSTKNKALVPIEVNLPAPAVYDLLKEQMDVNEEDLNDQISMLIESQINNMKESLKEQISSFIINYYQK
jgi:hypothetical protein